MTYVGKWLQVRMNMFGLTQPVLTIQAFQDEDTLDDLLHDRLAIENIDPFDLDLLCSALRCDSTWFTEESVRDNDPAYQTYKKGITDPKTLATIAGLTLFSKDMAFLMDIKPMTAKPQ